MAVKQQRQTLHADQQAQGRSVFPFDVQPAEVQPSQQLRQAAPQQPRMLSLTHPQTQPQTLPSVQPEIQAAPADVLREAEAQQALAELFPHLKLHALRAIQDLFPLRAARKDFWH